MEIRSAARSLLQTTFSPIDYARRPAAEVAANIPQLLQDPGAPAIEQAARLRLLAMTDEELLAAEKAVSKSERAILAAMRSAEPTALITAVAKAADDAMVEQVFADLVDRRRATVNQAAQALESWVEETEAAVVDHRVGRVLAGLVEQRAVQEEEVTAVVDLTRRLSVDGARELAARLATASPKERGEVMAEFERRATRVTGGADGPESQDDARQLQHVEAALRSSTLARVRVKSLSPSDRLAASLAAATAAGVDVRKAEVAMAALGITDPSQVDGIAHAFHEWDQFTAKVAKASITPQPIGYLHLERLSFIPAGIEHGELVYSLPLGPDEEVSIVHKEWSNTEEEFQRLIADSFEEYSEQGVVDKISIADATTHQHQHSTGFSVSVSASGGYGPISAQVNTSYKTQSSDAESRSSSLNHSKSVTERASARSRKEHRISFKTATKSQIEDQTVRKIKNPDPVHPVRYDYFQLMRKWRVDVHRYGVRLTYDLTIPEPGGDLLAVYDELAELEDLIEKGFEFKLNPEAVNRDSFSTHAAPTGPRSNRPRRLFARSRRSRS